MKLKVKLPLFTSIILLVSITTVSILSIWRFSTEINKNINSYRKEATAQILSHLKDIVNIAYAMIDNAYQESRPEVIEKKYGIHLQDTSLQAMKMLNINLVKLTLDNLRVLRYGTDGYIWINEFNPPYKVVMHPMKPELEGKAWIFYIENTDKNVYEAFHDSIVAGNGAGRVSYNFYKPGTNEKIPKISWVRLYEPLGWVIGTGVYVDYIDKIVKKKKEALKMQIRNLVIAVSIISIIFIIISSLLLTLFALNITNPIYKIRDVLSEMAKGKIVEKPPIFQKDEIGDMKKSLDMLIDGWEEYARFALEIGKGNFKAQFERLSNEDVLGNALISMRDNLALAREQEQKRLEEERIRQWINSGLNRMSDIITLMTETKQLSENIIPRLVDYIGATLGSIYVLNFDNEGAPFLELSAMVAYNRQKYLHKEIAINEGLVGACFMEKEPIFITDVPPNYISIKSGLGEALPRNLYFTPMLFENKNFGVIEIASFKILAEHERTFVDEVAKMLAVSLSSKERYVNW